MAESMKAFAKICRKVETPIVLFFTHLDFLSNIINEYPISDYYPDYIGGIDCKEACDYFAKKFRLLDCRLHWKKELQLLHIYHINTLDTDTFERTFHEIGKKDLDRPWSKLTPFSRLPYETRALLRAGGFTANIWT